MGNQALSSLTLQIILSTTPERQELRFDECVREGYFKKYREGIGKYCADKDADYCYSDNDKSTPVLYNPISYYILGNYDIAYISLIDNFKFAQKLFEPQIESVNSEGYYLPHTFQSFTGITHTDSDQLREFFSERLRKSNPKRSYFIGICNMKLNNAFLIGNGKKFLEAVFRKIREYIDSFNQKSELNIDYLLLHTFSWFEVSLLIFTDDPNHIGTLVTDLRGLSIKDLPESAEDLCQHSLYEALRKLSLGKTESSPEEDSSSLEEIKKANIFADTHTYVGMHSDLVQCKEDDPYLKEFLGKNLTLITDIEWQVKPGHMPLLIDMLNRSILGREKVFETEQRYLLAGKSDYLLKETSDLASNNLHLVRTLTSGDSPFFVHVRKIKTRISFNVIKKKLPEDRRILNIQLDLQKLGFDHKQIMEVDKQLKCLKVSRQIRSKILKIFSNYNNGIQDLILYPFFLDFKIFLEELERQIKEERLGWEANFDLPIQEQEKTSEVSKLEISLMKRIESFQEGYNIRMLNSYQFEDITDFDLDFNSSIQQLLSSYSAFAFEIGNLFYKRHYQYGPIVQLNLKDTVSNYNSINYYIHHLTSPEFVFATITKEVLNLSTYDIEGLRKVIEKYEGNLGLLSVERPHLFIMIQQNMIDINYLVIDTIRYFITYDMKFGLYYYWFWTYNLQNASLYDKHGLLNENHFKKELFRVLFIAKLFAEPTDDLSCPLPELFTFWDRHFEETKELVEHYHGFLAKSIVLSDFMGLVYKVLDKWITISTEGLPFHDKRHSNAAQKFNKIRKELQLPSVSSFLAKLSYKEIAFERFMSDPEPPAPDHQLLFFQWFMLQYLNDIYVSNRGKISLLRRSWEDGSPLRSFTSGETNGHMYSVDQTGGLFFDDMGQLNAYFKKSVDTLYALWDFSMAWKKKFMLAKIKQYNEEKTRTPGSHTLAK